ncbi:hypothetical protein [Cognatishimia activa]|uniref:hypothetical protein n=1 Tax=Cognatishimia activa TaxID=1715691 RepID=UPI00222E955B|nr:hypothetical protein [Cognatishimia activa]UZD91738.1 hypothetical protein M0D42_03735 [Cognatishimia activa]
MSEEPIAIIEASPPRRWLAIGMQLSLGGILIYLSTSMSHDFGWQVFLLLLGGGWVFLAMRMYAATQMHLILNEKGLWDSSGDQLAAMEDIESVSRGMFAFKPSNGFSLVLKKSKGPARWRPGLWWRLGSRVGVGGVTAGSQTKPAAQIIEAILAQRTRDTAS